MINKAKLENAVRKLSQIDIDRFRKSFVIVPYKVSGFMDFTNRGQVDKVVNPNDYETFKRVWTGNDAAVISWKDSVSLVQQLDDSMKVVYNLGEVFLGELLDNTSNVDVSTDTSFSDYTSQQSNISLQFRVSNFFKIDTQYDFMFYKFPELYGSTLFRIESNEKEFLGMKLMSYTINFRSINQEFANTGRARQQNIMPGAPGQGYIEPVVVKETDWQPSEAEIPGVDYYELFDRYIIPNRSKLRQNPIARVEVKLFGTGIFSSLTFLGRPVKTGDDFTKFSTPRIIFPTNLEEVQLPTLYRTQQVTSNYYAGAFAPTLMYMKDMMTQVKDSMTPLNKWESQGTLQFTESEIKATNPIVDGTYQFALSGWVDPETALVRAKWTPKLPLHTINTSMVPGCESRYQIGGFKTIENHMFDWYWTQKKMKYMPMNISSALGFGFALGSSIGAMVTKQFWMGAALALIGIAGTLIQGMVTPKFEGFNGIISSELLDMNDQYGDGAPGTYDKLSMNILLSQSIDNPSSIFFAGNTMSTGFSALLTDALIDKRLPNVRLDTGNIGQSQFENGDYIFEDKSPYLLDGINNSLTSMLSNKDGFIIDQFSLQAIFDGEFSVEFIDIYGDVAWSGIYKSEGNWTKSLREIWSIKNTSVFGRENMFYSKPIPYPKELPEFVPEFPVDRQGTGLKFNFGGYLGAGSNVGLKNGIVLWDTPPTFFEQGPRVNSKALQTTLLDVGPINVILKNRNSIRLKLFYQAQYHKYYPNDAEFGPVQEFNVQFEFPIEDFVKPDFEYNFFVGELDAPQGPHPANMTARSIVGNWYPDTKYRVVDWWWFTFENIQFKSYFDPVEEKLYLQVFAWYNEVQHPNFESYYEFASLSSSVNNPGAGGATGDYYIYTSSTIDVGFRIDDIWTMSKKNV